MRGFKHWLQHQGITVIFWLAVAILSVLVVCSYIIPATVPDPGEQQTTPLPWAADLCMAYIGAYFFHYLVVELPAKRKRESRLKTLQTPLTAIAFNGLDMVRELERIAKCPHRRVTEKHLRKVLQRLKSNLYIRTHLTQRMERARAAYLAIVPYAADLPLDLQERLQEENQHLAHMAFNLPPEKRERWVSLVKLREFTLMDFPLDSWLPYILSYYETTEAVRRSLEKHMPSTRAYLPGERTREPGKSPTLRSGRSSSYFGLHEQPEYPYWTYPTPYVKEPKKAKDEAVAEGVDKAVDESTAQGDEESKEPAST